MKLPKTIDFNEADFPELQDIFQHIDTAIAAIVASDPAFHSTRQTSRRARAKSSLANQSARVRKTRRNAA